MATTTINHETRATGYGAFWSVAAAIVFLIGILYAMSTNRVRVDESVMNPATRDVQNSQTPINQ